MMRISGGEWGGRPLSGPKKPVIRPTEDRVRQALFNILGHRIIDALVLDLYAGTGALGLESLSRGAARAVFIDKHNHALDLIRDNLRRFEVSSDQYHIFSGDALQWLSRNELKNQGPFDIIFIDPPYEMDLYQPALIRIAESEILSRDGWAVLEYSIRRPPAPPTDPWQCIKTRTYGETALDFWRYSG